MRLAEDIRDEAKRLKISPAIIAGRLRRQANDYKIHRTLIGQGKVREILGFAEDAACVRRQLKLVADDN